GTPYVVTGGSLSITAPLGAGTASSPLQTSAGDLSVDTSGGNTDQFITRSLAIVGITGLNLNAGTGNITLSETGGIADTDAGTDITANIAVVTISGATVQSVGSSTNPIVTSVNDLTLNTATGGGSQFVTNS